MIHFFYGENETVEEYASVVVRSNDTVTGDCILLLISFHVGKAYPTGTPTLSV